MDTTTTDRDKLFTALSKAQAKTRTERSGGFTLGPRGSYPRGSAAPVR